MKGILDLSHHSLYLASSSPRRRELLGHLGLPFSVNVPDIEEQRRSHESIIEYVKRNAREKASAVLQLLPNSSKALVIGSDTIGLLDGELLEKPRDVGDAKRMLRLLSGKTHEVLTSLAVVKLGDKQEFLCFEELVTTRVRFKTLGSEEIDYYVATGEPMDKAGGYGIQGIGGFMVERIDGSYSNVVGLPLVELVSLLKSALKESIPS